MVRLAAYDRAIQRAGEKKSEVARQALERLRRNIPTVMVIPPRRDRGEVLREVQQAFELITDRRAGALLKVGDLDNVQSQLVEEGSCRLFIVLKGDRVLRHQLPRLEEPQLIARARLLIISPKPPIEVVCKDQLPRWTTLERRIGPPLHWPAS